MKKRTSSGWLWKRSARVIWIAVFTGIRIILPAQPVEFQLQLDLLRPATGYAPHTDCAVDMNGDQLDDVVRVGSKGIYIDYQEKDGSFTQEYFPLATQALPVWSICAGDLDNNGLTDLLLGDDKVVAFLKASSSGEDYLESVMPGYIFSQRSTLADINNDGWLDGFVCHDLDQSIPYRNDGSGNMAPDYNLIQTADRPGSYSAIWTDYDLDRDIDLYITKCEAGAPPGAINRTNLLYRNNGDGTFSEVGALAGLDDNAQSWSTVFEDFDNDGDFDAFIVNHDFQNRLFRNNADGTFTDVITSSGINPNDLGAWENASGDFNNDGFIDIFSQLQQELYLGHGDMTFTGMESPVTPGAIADLNNDGYLDVYTRNLTWINQPNENHYIKFSLLGRQTNRNGIGSSVVIYGPWGTQTREVRSGQSYSPMGSLNVHFGLGAYDMVDSTKIYWPSGIVTSLYQMAADSMYFIPETECMTPQRPLVIEGSAFLCPGDSVRINAPAGFATYAWSTGDTGSTISASHARHYFALCIDSMGCGMITPSVDIKIIEEHPPVITAIQGNIICAGDTILLMSSPGQNYAWSNGSTGIQSIAVSQGGDYFVAVDALCQDGQLESRPFSVVVLDAPSPAIEDVFVLPGDSVLIQANGENCAWYDQESGGQLLGTGSTFQTGALDQSQSLFVERRYEYPGSVQSGGKTDTSGTGGLPAQNGFLHFTTWAPFTLLSVTVYTGPEGPLGTRFIELVSGDSVLAKKGFELTPGKNVVELQFHITPGDYILRSQQGALWRNTGQLQYPYPIGDAGEIEMSNRGKDFYYYFYDWQIKTEDYTCVSDRSRVNIIVSSDARLNSPLPFNIFPNPTDGKIWIMAESNLIPDPTIRIIDGYGRVIFHQTPAGGLPVEADLSFAPSGIYILQITSKRETWSTRIYKTSN